MPDQPALATAARAPRPSRLEHFPVAFFAMIMGLAGLSIAWHKAQATFDMHWLDLALGLRWLATGLFVLMLGMFLGKLARHWPTVVREFNHPIQLNFFPTISISLLLLAVTWLPSQPGAAAVLWIAGAVLHLLLTLHVLGMWIHREHFEIHHINPAWFIPIVGNAIVPVAGVSLGFTELSWFYFSIAMVLWLVLFAIIVYRMLFHAPLPDRLMPTLFILIAPPAVGFIAYVALSGIMAGGELDAFARILYYTGLFLTLLLLSQAARFVRLHFYISWWAYSFPLAAITIATLIMFDLTGLVAFALIGWFLLSLVTLLVLFLLWRTAVAAGSRTICVPLL